VKLPKIRTYLARELILADTTSLARTRREFVGEPPSPWERRQCGKGITTLRFLRDRIDPRREMKTQSLNHDDLPGSLTQ
jgi:hypothetical protein